jgi:cation:H+ antiporter
MSDLILVAIFLVSTAVIWITGIHLTKAIDHITDHYDLGEAFGGMVFLAIVTNLPEIAITVVAAYHRDYAIAVSNILGGIAIQTVVLVLIDVFGVGRTAPLTWKGHSKVLVLEGVALIFILTLVLMGTTFPSSFLMLRSTPFEWMIAFIWLGSIYMISKVGKSEPDYRSKQDINYQLRHPNVRFKGTLPQAFFVLAGGAVLTLSAGWALEASGEMLSVRWGMDGVLFGGTILALCTALPEISTGIASARIRDYNMAVSDIFGGNAFLPVLFLVASLIGGDAILPSISHADIYLTALGIFLTGIYMVGMVIHPKKQILRMGYDSFTVLLVYLLGIAGLLVLL